MKTKLIAALLLATLIGPACADFVSPNRLLFDYLDKDNNGSVSRLEWNGLYIGKVTKEKIYDIANLDKADSLTFAEFDTSSRKVEVSRLINKPIARVLAFLSVDTDKDNVISREEAGYLWMPGTPKSKITTIWKLVSVNNELSFYQWMKAKTLPTLNSFIDARKLRSDRAAVAKLLDDDENELISFEEFANLFPSKATDNEIQEAWDLATRTDKREKAPDNITIHDFIETRKLPEF